jgi:hypothetical protein
MQLPLPLTDGGLPKVTGRPADLASLFAEWASLPVPRPDFLTFAHHRRRGPATPAPDHERET